MLTAPLQVQPHQVVYVEAETDVGDSAAGVGLAAERSKRRIGVKMLQNKTPRATSIM